MYNFVATCVSGGTPLTKLSLNISLAIADIADGEAKYERDNLGRSSSKADAVAKCVPKLRFSCTPAKWRGGLKSPALVVLETTRYPTQRKNSPFENNQIQSSGKGGYQTQSVGTDGGTNWLLILQNLAFMRVSSHHSSGFTHWRPL